MKKMYKSILACILAVGMIGMGISENSIVMKVKAESAKSGSIIENLTREYSSDGNKIENDISVKYIGTDTELEIPMSGVSEKKTEKTVSDGNETHIHSFTNDITKKPGCVDEGVRTFICLGCGETYTEIIPAIGHQYITDKEPATTDENGSIIKYCGECGDESVTTIYAVKTIELAKTSFIYDGKIKKPYVIVKDIKGQLLKEGEDYIVSYPQKTKNVGYYTAEIEFKDNYLGNIKKAFTIIPKGSGIGKLISKGKTITVKWKKQANQISGYEIAFSSSSNFTKKTTNTVTVSKNKTVSRTLLSLKPKKKYYVRIRTYKNVKADGKSTRIYSSWSKSKSATTKADNVKNIPQLNARVTTGNIFKILNKYDKDGAYILRNAMQAGDDILEWFSPGSRIIDGIDTAVHEETHGYSHHQGSISFHGQDIVRTTAYFVGNGKTINVPHTNIYFTKKMASSIPKRLRTHRYNTYVAKPSENLSSNVQGVYGLMNEFMAYRMGMSTTVSLYQYYVDMYAGWDAWENFIHSGENGRTAYAEFKYYILNYLSYAKKHYPEVYQGIMKNKEFCKTYYQLESSYVKLIAAYEKDLKKVQEIMEEKGQTITINADSVIMEEKGVGIGRFTNEYKKLQKEIKKSTYQSIHRKLVANGR